METIIESNVKAIRVGDKIMVFINGDKKTISQKVSPEIFNVILEYIKNNQQERIGEVFNNFDDRIETYLGNSFDIKNNSIFFKGTDKEVLYSKLILRKALELLAMNESPEPLIKLSNKIKTKQKFEDKGTKIFQNIKNLIITKNGNLIFHTKLNFKSNLTSFGSPINVLNGRYSNSYKIQVVFNYEVEEPDTYILINPFDITSFEYTSINVSRIKVLKNIDIKNKTVVDIKNEEVFDIPYEIFLLKNSKNL
jgi:hypothetical protein